MDNGCGISLDSWGTIFNISANKIANNNGTGISIRDCEGYIRGNDIVNNGGDGIYGADATCYISGNNITSNAGNGIHITLGGGSEIYENSIIANKGSGIRLASSCDRIYHNTFENNTKQVIDDGTNEWDDGYPSGGNYWSDYFGVDFYSGPYQNETGSDGIGDIPYIIDEYNQDKYPLMKPHPWGPHDIGITDVTTSKTVVGKRYNLNITVTIFNYGIYTETFNITVYANTTAIASQNATLTSRNSTIITFTWNTTGFSHAYNITTYARASILSHQPIFSQYVTKL